MLVRCGAVRCGAIRVWWCSRPSSLQPFCGRYPLLCRVAGWLRALVTRWYSARLHLLLGADWQPSLFDASARRPASQGAPYERRDRDPLRKPGKDGAANRERILDCAQELFVTDGLHVSLHGTADDLRIGIGTVYRHFATHADLYVGMHERIAGATDAEGRPPPARRSPRKGDGLPRLRHSHFV